MSKRKKILLMILSVLLILLLALALGGFAVVKSYLGQIGRVDGTVDDIVAPEDEFFDVDEEPASSGDQQGSGTPSAEQPDSAGQQGSTAPGKTDTPADPPAQGDDVISIDPSAVEWSFIERIEDDHLINILLVGQDKYPGVTTTKRQRSDTMILCSINPETGKVSLISFLRDLYVQIPGGYSDNRLNVPYVLGGFPLLDETLTTNFGVSVDANFEVDLTGFEAIIDMIGGVDLELTEAEAAYFNKTWNAGVVVGTNHFGGEYARNFAQLRKIDSDFGRTNRQREVLLAVYNKVKSLPVNDLLALLYDALPYLTTDLTDTEILSLAYRLLPMVPSLQIETHSVPSSGTYYNAKVRGMAVLMPDREKIRQQLATEYLPLG